MNLDKREYVHPHPLGDGLKLIEQGLSGPGGIMTALHVLLAVSNGRGGGDYNSGDAYKTYPRREDVPAGARILTEYDTGDVYVLENTPAKELADKVVGRWGGDRIAIIGDYAEPDDLPVEDAGLIYTLCTTKEDLEAQIKELLEEEGHQEHGQRLREIVDQYGPFTNITLMVRDYLVECDGFYHTFTYEGDGWAERTFDMRRREGM